MSAPLIVSAVMGHPGNWTCGDIARAVERDPNEVHRVVRVMRSCGLVSRVGVARVPRRGQPAHVYRVARPGPRKA